MKHTRRTALRGIGLQFFAMKNLDAVQKERAEILQRMTQAVQDNDQEKFMEAFGDLADAIGESILGDVKALQAAQDDSILTARGCRVLTSQERQYYEAIIGAMKSDDPKQALTSINKVLPETVIDAVFQDLTGSHPLLSLINFQNTGALVKILLSTTGGGAKWGPIDKKITEELSANFLELDLTLAALTAFLPVNRYMLDLGPAWLDRYVRELLSEALAVELESGIIAGNGKDAPIGMMKKLTGAVDGVYSDKEAVAVTDLSPASYGPPAGHPLQGPQRQEPGRQQRSAGGESGGLFYQSIPRHHRPGLRRDLQQGRVPLPYYGGAVGGGTRRAGGHGPACQVLHGPGDPERREDRVLRRIQIPGAAADLRHLPLRLRQGHG